MEMTRTYKVAGHVFSVTMPEEEPVWDLMGQYDPFVIDPLKGDVPVFRLVVCPELPDLPKEPMLVAEPEPGISRIDVYSSGETLIFEMAPLASLPTVGVLHTDRNFSEGRLFFSGNGRTKQFALNNSLMLMFAFSTAPKGTLMMHASVTVHKGKGYLFLGKSGTGKSTHSRMWLENIPGTELLNDDNPVVRVFDNEVRVYGSPWSGKTPCYRNLDFPVGANVRIKRAPYNKASRLPLMESYASVYSSCSSLRVMKKIADVLHEAVSGVAFKAPCFVMECLPDAEAAFVCRKAVEEGE